ncbi:hypothetical protein FRC06_010526, partial [Ceratobasidium sp. 370]
MRRNNPPLASHKIAGRNGPTIQVSKYRDLLPQPLKAGKGTRKRKPGPHTVTFRVDGSIHPNLDQLPSPPLVQPDYEMARSPPPPSPLSDDIGETLGGLAGPDDSLANDSSHFKK